MKKIKLRDMTREQFNKWYSHHCGHVCEDCIFGRVVCDRYTTLSWVDNKDNYSDKFLDQEVKIDFMSILTKDEFDYLGKIISPLVRRRDDIRIEKWRNVRKNGAYDIVGIVKGDDGMILDELFSFETTVDLPFEGITQDDSLTLEELGL